MVNEFLRIPAIKVIQPLSSFYICSIKAKDLMEISFSEELRYVDDKGNVKGSQRLLNEKRLKEIARYIDSVEMAFPNSIILAANYHELYGQMDDFKFESWRFEPSSNNVNFGELVIPSKEKLAAIIDGQHRLKAFEYVENEQRENVELLCSVYFDLPNSYQAYLFATINGNQKRVDKSLALEQFGFNVTNESENAWTPEKLAVFISRKLNIDQNSPFHQHIKVAPQNEEVLYKVDDRIEWKVSTSTIVEGILKLISSNPKRDRVEMQQTSLFRGRSRNMLSDFRDSSPLREHFIKGSDQFIYDKIIEYFTLVNKTLWSKNIENSYIVKTVGIQALFDVLKILLNKDVNILAEDVIKNIENINFSDKFFQASGIGRSRIKNIICLANNLIDWESIKVKDYEAYKNILHNKKSTENTSKWLLEDEVETTLNYILEKVQWDYSEESIFIDSKYIEILGVKFENIYEDGKLFYKALLELVKYTVLNTNHVNKELSDELLESNDLDILVKNSMSLYKVELAKLNWNLL